jgi:photosystem II stability/assembly factor-like uncharacterized protein
VPKKTAPLLVAALLVVSPAVAAAACPDPVPESEWSVVMPLAAKTLMLDIAQVGETFVVVGDRGHVLISEDQGRSWAQKRTPTRALLTGVWFHDRDLGWAVGHDAVILRTEDGGETWCRVHWAPELERPLLDIWFSDARNGFAVGAYGYLLRSADGGLSWREEPLDLVADFDPDDAYAEADADADADSTGAPGDDDESFDEAADGDEAGWDDDEWVDDEVAADLHLNRILRGNGELFLAAEGGTVFRSGDDGFSWVALDPPYDGSFFGGVGLADDSILVYGLRGNMFRSWDGGQSWREVSLPVDTSLFGGARLSDGGVVVVGTAGVMLVSREGERFRLVQRPDRKALVAAMATTDDAVIVIGEPGIERLERRILAGE